MDKIDRTIVRLLQEDGRLTHEQISREVHLSRPAVHDRIKRLEQAGVIRGYRAEVDWDAVGLPLGAFVWIRVVGSHCIPTGQRVLALSNEKAMIPECHRVAGEWCLLAEVRAASTLALQDLLDQINGLPSVQGTMTTVSLSIVARAEDPASLVRPAQILNGSPK